VIKFDPWISIAHHFTAALLHRSYSTVKVWKK